MREIADGLWQMDALLPNVINVYLVRTPEGDVLIDAGTRWVTGRLLRQLRGRRLALVALTHVHPDHQGAAAEVCRRFGVPLACHEADGDVMEGQRRMQPDNAILRVGQRLFGGPSWPVARRWRGGETFGEWRVVPTPGHTMGHVSFFRERDRALIVGDVARNTFPPSRPRGLVEPPHAFSVDPLLNRRSMRALVELRPELVCFGHGPASRDVAGLERLASACGERGAFTQPREGGGGRAMGSL